jgi:hypothetical protein
VPLARIFDALSPHARVATALAPFVVAILARLVVGQNRVTRIMISCATLWFTVNVLLAPFSDHMGQDLVGLYRRVFH